MSRIIFHSLSSFTITAPAELTTPCYHSVRFGRHASKQNAPTTPLAIIGLYSGNSVDDHAMIVATLKHFFAKSGANATGININGREGNLGGGANGAHEGDGE